LKCDCKEQLDWAMDYIHNRSLSAATKKNSTAAGTHMNGDDKSASHANGNNNNNHNDTSKRDRRPSNGTTTSSHQCHGGMIIYMPQEGRGIGLANKLKAYSLQIELGLDTVDANRALGFPDDLRSYNVVPAILDDMNIKSIKLMTNNPRKVDVLSSLGIEVAGTIPVIVQPNSTYAAHYLHTKANRMQHNITLQYS